MIIVLFCLLVAAVFAISITLKLAKARLQVALERSELKLEQAKWELEQAKQRKRRANRKLRILQKRLGNLLFDKILKSVANANTTLGQDVETAFMLVVKKIPNNAGKFSIIVSIANSESYVWTDNQPIPPLFQIDINLFQWGKELFLAFTDRPEQTYPITSFAELENKLCRAFSQNEQGFL